MSHIQLQRGPESQGQAPRCGLFASRSSAVEQTPCKRQAGGSNPPRGSICIQKRVQRAVARPATLPAHAHDGYEQRQLPSSVAEAKMFAASHRFDARIARKFNRGHMRETRLTCDKCGARTENVRLRGKSPTGRGGMGLICNGCSRGNYGRSSGEAGIRRFDVGSLRHAVFALSKPLDVGGSAGL